MTLGKLAGAALLLAVLLLLTGQGHAHYRGKPLPKQFVRGALCIHRYEGSWRDTGAPYYGGLQFDYGFMSTYGTWLLRNRGTADRWTPHEQLTVAYRAYRGWKGYRGRGWSPWPATSRMCGLA